MTGKRFIGDIYFDELKEIPGFTEEARKLIASDWREGTKTFPEYAGPKVDKIREKGGFVSWGEFNFEYIESRIMEHLKSDLNPWLWAYKIMTRALVDPETVRTALRSIENGDG